MLARWPDEFIRLACSSATSSWSPVGARVVAQAMFSAQPQEPVNLVAGCGHALPSIRSACARMRERIGADHPLAVSFRGFVQITVKCERLCAGLRPLGIHQF